VREASGFRHLDDGYYYRPLVAGKELYTYVAHVPSRGYMPPDAEEAKEFELSLFMIDGELVVILDADELVARPGDAVHVPRGVASQRHDRGTVDGGTIAWPSCSRPEGVRRDHRRERVPAALTLERSRIVRE